MTLYTDHVTDVCEQCRIEMSYNVMYNVMYNDMSRRRDTSTMDIHLGDLRTKPRALDTAKELTQRSRGRRTLASGHLRARRG